MKVDLGIWHKLTRLVVVAIGLTALTGLVYWYAPLIRTNERMRQRNLALETEVSQREQWVAQEEAAVKLLQSDPKTIERMARQKLGFAKTGEVVIFFGPRTNSSPTTNGNR